MLSCYYMHMMKMHSSENRNNNSTRRPALEQSYDRRTDGQKHRTHVSNPEINGTTFDNTAAGHRLRIPVSCVVSRYVRKEVA